MELDANASSLLKAQRNVMLWLQKRISIMCTIYSYYETQKKKGNNSYHPKVWLLVDKLEEEDVLLCHGGELWIHTRSYTHGKGHFWHTWSNVTHDFHNLAIMPHSESSRDLTQEGHVTQYKHKVFKLIQCTWINMSYPTFWDPWVIVASCYDLH